MDLVHILQIDSTLPSKLSSIKAELLGTLCTSELKYSKHSINMWINIFDFLPEQLRPTKIYYYHFGLITMPYPFGMALSHQTISI